MVELCSKCGSVVPPAYLDMPHLTPHEHLVYTYIAKHAGCDVNDLISHLYSHDPNGGPVSARNVVFVYISRINNKLQQAKLGHGIANISLGYPARYQLKPVDLEGMLNAHLNLPPVLSGL